MKIRVFVICCALLLSANLFAMEPSQNIKGDGSPGSSVEISWKSPCTSPDSSHELSDNEFRIAAGVPLMIKEHAQVTNEKSWCLCGVLCCISNASYHQIN